MAILVEDMVRGIARRFGRQWDNFRANWEHYEFKTGKKKKEPPQKPRDEHAMANPGTVGDPAVTNIRDIRVFPQQIPIEFAVADAERRLGELVDVGIIDGSTRSALIDAILYHIALIEARAGDFKTDESVNQCGKRKRKFAIGAAIVLLEDFDGVGLWRSFPARHIDYRFQTYAIM